MYSRTVPRRTISLGAQPDDTTRVVLEMYEEALKQVFEVTDAAPLVAGDEKVKSAWWIPFVAPVLRALHINAELTDRTFPEWTLTLMPKAVEVFDAFQKFIYAIIAAEAGGVANGANAAAEEEISHPYILVMHLLLRMMLTALSQDLFLACGGDKLISVMDKFICAVNGKKLLPSRGRLDRLGDFVRNQHTLGCFERACLTGEITGLFRWAQRAVLVTETLQANQRALKDNTDFLENLEYQLKLRIISILDPYFSKGNQLVKEGTLITDTLKACEDSCIRSQVVPLDKKREEQVALTFYLNTRHASNYQLLQKLYRLLDDTTHFFLPVLEEYVVLNSVAGWIPLMMGFLTVKDLVSELRQHKKACDEALMVRKGDRLVRDRLPMAGFLLQCRAANIALSEFQVTADPIDALERLIDPTVWQKLKEYAQQSILQLCRLQQGRRIIFINQARGRRFFDMLGMPAEPEQAPRPAAAKRPMAPMNFFVPQNECLFKYDIEKNTFILVWDYFSQEENAVVSLNSHLFCDPICLTLLRQDLWAIIENYQQVEKDLWNALNPNLNDEIAIDLMSRMQAAYVAMDTEILKYLKDQLKRVPHYLEQQLLNFIYYFRVELGYRQIKFIVEALWQDKLTIESALLTPMIQDLAIRFKKSAGGARGGSAYRQTYKSIVADWGRDIESAASKKDSMVDLIRYRRPMPVGVGVDADADAGVGVDADVGAGVDENAGVGVDENAGVGADAGVAAAEAEAARAVLLREAADVMRRNNVVAEELGRLVARAKEAERNIRRDAQRGDATNAILESLFKFYVLFPELTEGEEHEKVNYGQHYAAATRGMLQRFQLVEPMDDTIRDDLCTTIIKCNRWGGPHFYNVWGGTMNGIELTDKFNHLLQKLPFVEVAPVQIYPNPSIRGKDLFEAAVGNEVKLALEDRNYVKVEEENLSNSQQIAIP